MHDFCFAAVCWFTVSFTTCIMGIAFTKSIFAVEGFTYAIPLSVISIVERMFELLCYNTIEV